MPVSHLQLLCSDQEKPILQLVMFLDQSFLEFELFTLLVFNVSSITVTKVFIEGPVYLPCSFTTPRPYNDNILRIFKDSKVIFLFASVSGLQLRRDLPIRRPSRASRIGSSGRILALGGEDEDRHTFASLSRHPAP